MTFTKDCLDTQNKVSICVIPDLGPNPDPGLLASASSCVNVDSACVFAPVASLAIGFVSESIFWNLVE